MSKPNVSTTAEQQRPLGFWYDRTNNIVQLVTVKSNPTQAKPNRVSTLQVQLSGSATAIKVVNLGDLIQEDPFASTGLADGKFLCHDHSSFSKRYSALNLPAFGD